MTGRTQPMMPMIPRKIARVMIMMLTITVGVACFWVWVLGLDLEFEVCLYLISAFVWIILEVNVAPGIYKLVVLGFEGFFVKVPNYWEVVKGASFAEGTCANICCAAPAVVHFPGGGTDSGKGAGIRLEVFIGEVEVEIKLLLCAFSELLIASFHLGVCYINCYAILENVRLVIACGVHGFIDNTTNGKLGTTLPADEAEESVGVLVIQAVNGFPAGGNGPVGKLLGGRHKEIDTAFLGFAGLDVLAGVIGILLDRIALPAGNVVVGGNIFLSHVGSL